MNAVVAVRSMTHVLGYTSISRQAVVAVRSMTLSSYWDVVAFSANSYGRGTPNVVPRLQYISFPKTHEHTTDGNIQ